MYILLYLFLSHFLADYLFQPNWLARFKKRAFAGTLVHGLIVGFVMMVVLIPYLYSPAVRYGIAAITLMHVVIDYGKVKIAKAHPKTDGRVLYILDQILHLALIVLIGIVAIGPIAPQSIPQAVAQWYSNAWFLAYLLALVIGTYFYDVTRYIFSRHAGQLDYKRDYYGMALRATIVTLGFLLAWIVVR
ncbi:DUF3307 domain-containing protein [Candidatus Peregrinibacteria bacterium]|nr:DUF3307 domain-containing protein [Candidatus Peregrinibacteria bacterium]